MTEKIIKEITETREHSLEEFFDIERGTTEVTRIEQETTLVKVEEYDEKDEEIEQNFQEVYDKAISGYENLQEAIQDDLEPKYISRAQEVANQLLGTALQAAAQKAGLKKHKDKLDQTQSKGGTKTVNNTLVIDTNTLIAQLKQISNASTPIEGSAEEVKAKE